MDTVKDLPKDGRPVTLVTTGEGTSEFRRLAAFSTGYNGEKVLWFPKRPKYSPFRKSSRFNNQRIGGLDVLEVLTVYPGAYGLHRFLFIIDKDYFGGEPKKDIKDKLRKLRITINSLEELNTGSFYVSCKYGAHELAVYLAISGKTKEIEEDIANLIELEYNKPVDPTKSGIGKFFREKGLKDTQLIKNAKKTNLRKAFPNLNSTLMEIKKINSES